MSNDTALDRDARAALAGLLSNQTALQGIGAQGEEEGIDFDDAVAGAAYGFALAMRKARKKLKGEGVHNAFE